MNFDNPDTVKKYIEACRDQALENPLIQDREKLRQVKKGKRNWIPSDCWHRPLLLRAEDGGYKENAHCSIRGSCSNKTFEEWLRKNYHRCYLTIRKLPENCF